MENENYEIMGMNNKVHHFDGFIPVSRLLIDLNHIFFINVNDYIITDNYTREDIISNGILDTVNTIFMESLIYKIITNTLTDSTILLSGILSDVFRSNAICSADINLVNWSVIETDVKLFKEMLNSVLESHLINKIFLYDDGVEIYTTSDFHIIKYLSGHIICLDQYHRKDKYDKLYNKYKSQ